MTTTSFTAKFLKVFTLATFLTLGLAQQGFCACAAEDEEFEEDRLKSAERGLLDYFLAQKLQKFILTM